MKRRWVIVLCLAAAGIGVAAVAGAMWWASGKAPR